MKRLLSIGIILLFIGLSISSSTGFNLEKESSNTPLDGKTLYVGGSGPGNYTKIQDAIDNASDGDTVFVYNGTYYENMVKVDKSINLIGEDKNSTCIDGQNQNGIIILVLSSNVKISDFILINSYYNNGFGQAIYLWGNDTYLENIYISDCIINKGDKGVFFINVNNLFITNCHIYNIRGPTIWGYENNSNIIISNCIAHNNGVNLGGGWIRPGSFMYSINNSNINIFKCNIHDIIGSGIYFNYNGDKVDIFQNNIYRNSWSGVRFTSFKPVFTNINLNNNHIYNNDINGVSVSGIANPGIEINSNNISYNGHDESFPDGGIYLQDCNIYAVDINNNIISSNNGTGIYPIRIPNIDIIENEIIKNTKEGIHLSDSENALIQGNNIIENKIGICLEFRSSTVYGNIISGNEIGINITRSNNVIRNNELLNNHDGIIILGYGLYEEQGNENYIFANNFRRNKRNAFFEYWYDLFDPMKIIFKDNYWNRPRFLPIPIFGQLRLLSNWLKNPLKLPWIVFDRSPVQNPNAINQDYFSIQNTKHLSNYDKLENFNNSRIEERMVINNIPPHLYSCNIKLLK